MRPKSASEILSPLACTVFQTAEIAPGKPNEIYITTRVSHLNLSFVLKQKKSCLENVLLKDLVLTRGLGFEVNCLQIILLVLILLQSLSCHINPTEIKVVARKCLFAILAMTCRVLLSLCSSLL